MPNPKYVLIFDECLDTGLSDPVNNFNSIFGKIYNIVLFSEARKNQIYQNLSPFKAAEKIIKENIPEIVLFNLLGDYLANFYKLRENERKVGLISKGEAFDNSCIALYGKNFKDLKFVCLNGNPEETKKNLDAMLV